MIVPYSLLLLFFIPSSFTQSTTTTIAPSCAELIITEDHMAIQRVTLIKFMVSWLDWSSWTTCSDSCGSCGIRTRTRVCLFSSSSCSCPGDGLGVEYCNVSVCRYPRQSCCNSMRVTTVNGIFACQS